MMGCWDDDDGSYCAVLNDDVMILKQFISDLRQNKCWAIGIVPIYNPDGNKDDEDSDISWKPEDGDNDLDENGNDGWWFI